MKVRYRKTYYAVSLLIGDLFMILTALRFSYWIKFQSGMLPSPMGTPDVHIYTGTFGFVLILFLFVFRTSGLYVEEKIASWMDEISLVFRATSISTLLVLGVSFFIRDISYSRGYFLTAWATIPVFVILQRFVLGYLYIALRHRYRKLNEVLVVGANRVSVRYAIRHARQARLCTRVVGLLDEKESSRTTYHHIPVLGTVKDLETVILKNPRIDQVVVTHAGFDSDQLFGMMMTCEKHLIAFKWVPDILSLVATQMQVGYDQGLALLSFKESPLSEWENRIFKRSMDILLAGTGLLLLLPFGIALALVVKLVSPGPAFYKQERVGEDGKSFQIYKFRTMRQDAESETGPVWASHNDSRRTPIGTFLRQSNIDELPQLWNVLKGDMSLVGPRPERPHFVGRFREDIPRYMGRHKIKSGITGWAQVNGFRGDTSIEERTKYDLFYIENWSVFFDLKILFMTPFSFRNAY